MKIKYFARLKNITNKNSEEIHIEYIKDTNDLKKYLIQKYPKFNEYFDKEDIIRLAINLEYTSKNTKIYEKDEIALFPPVSGG